MTWRLPLVIPGVLIVLVTACSGGSVSVGVGIPSIPLVPSTEPISVNGIVSGLDSVSVSGVRYDTSNTAVAINGQTMSTSDLRIGQRVTLQGEINALGFGGTANAIVYDADVIGPVESVDSDLGQLVVMGQRVWVDERTEFGSGIDPNSLVPIDTGDTLQISGLTKTNGDVVATLIRPDPVATRVQVIGEVAVVDIANMLFRINDLLVDYDSAGIIDLPAGMPATGVRLIARGVLADGILVAAELHASDDSVPSDPYHRVHIQGFVADYRSAAGFTVNGHPITTDFDTDYIGGVASDIRPDVEIAVDGRVSGDGRTILADQIRFGRLPSPTTTLTYDFRDFTELSVSSVFGVTVTQAGEFAVDVTVDEDLADYIVVAQNGNSLRLGLQPGNIDVRTIKANITLPTLSRIDLDGVVRANLEGFDQTRLDVTLRGVSLLRGRSSTITRLDAHLFGVSSLSFGDIRPIRTANIDVAGVSKVTVNMAVGASLEGSVTGPSVLRYYGTDVTVDVTTDLTASVVKLGETRP